MNVVDSSAWLEYYADGPNAAYFATAIEHVDSLVVPTVAVNEVRTSRGSTVSSTAQHLIDHGAPLADARSCIPPAWSVTFTTNEPTT